MKTGLYNDPIFLKHETGSHPENAGRLEAINHGLTERGLLKQVEVRQARPASQEEITAVHTLGYMRYMEESALAGRMYLDTPDCVLSHDTYSVALNAAGALVDAVVDVAERRLDNAFVACRPPGHHAEQGQAMGFCYFNNVAIAAATLTERMGYERVLIFDFDVHHGNGTQHTFEERKDVFFSSMHQHPLTLYPGTGFAEEKGRGEGQGYTLNAPMQPYAGDEEYMAVFERRLLPVFREYNPQFILVSAGFDAHQEDPLAAMNLTQRGFDHLIGRMKALALECCEGRIVSVLEGGYNYQRLAECVTSHVGHLVSDEGA